MTTTVSSKGQIVVPVSFRRKMALEAGDKLDVRLEEAPNGMHLVIHPKAKKRGKWKVVKDPITGWPVLKGPSGTPKLTSERVRQLLADFP